MAERLWMATDSDGEAYLYDRQPVRRRGGFSAKGDCCEIPFDDDDNMPPPGECWEYVRTDCVDTESGALAAAKAEIERLKAELDQACRDLTKMENSQRNLAISSARDIHRLAAELAEAKKMPECVAKLVAMHEGEYGFWDLEVSAVRRHYEPWNEVPG
jgi:hypothetical protein